MPTVRSYSRASYNETPPILSNRIFGVDATCCLYLY